MGGNEALITINHVPVECEVNENNHYRGMHMVIINPINGKILYSKVFDTYKTGDLFENFITNCVEDNTIVVAACKDECVTSLKESSK